VAQRNGDFSQQPRQIFDPLTTTAAGVRQPFAGNIIPPARISPAIKFFIDTVMPLPNRAGISNNLINTQSLSNDRDLWNMRFDHTFGAKDNVFFRYSNQKVGQVNPNANLNFYNTTRFDATTMAAAWNHIFSPTTVLEAKFGYNNPFIPGHDVSTKIGRADFLKRAGITMFQPDVIYDPLPNLNATGEFSIPNGGSDTEDHVYQAIGNFSKVVGRHTLKFGGTYNWRQFFTNTTNPMNGSADFTTTLTSLSTVSNSGSATASMLLGAPTAIRRALGNTYVIAYSSLQTYYAQDDWRMSSKLTVNLGIRYEFNQPAYANNDQIGNVFTVRDPQSGKYSAEFLWATKNPLNGEPPKQLEFGRALQAPDHTNFAPRIGVAYQITSKTVIRSAYGIFYDSTFFQELQDKRKFYPFTQQQLISPNTGQIPDLFITDAGPPFSSGIGGWPQDPHKRTPYSQQWNFTIQRQLMNDMTLDVAYVGAGNRHQIGYTTFNQAVTPGPGSVDPRRLLNNVPGLADLDGGVNLFTSNYHSFRTNLVKRFSSGVQFDTSYTWGKVLTTQSSLAEEIAQNQFNRHADYGRASFDIRHIFQGAFLYELPFGKGKKFGGSWSAPANMLLGGWSAQVLTRIETGTPVNVTLGSDRANIGKSAQRPNVLRNPDVGGNRNVDVPWFDITAFQLPVQYTYGNAAPYIVTTDGRTSWDFAAQKDFRFRERHSIQFRTEFFNLPNHVNFNNPTATFTSSSFGKVTSATPARQIQFGLRYAF